MKQFTGSRKTIKSVVIIAIMTLLLAAAAMLLSQSSYAFDGNKDDPYYSIEKVDEDGDPVIGAIFSIETFNLETGVTNYSIEILPDGTQGEMLTQWETTAANNGKLKLTSFAPAKTRVTLSEIVTPEGYETTADTVLVMWLNASTGDWEGTVNGVAVAPGTHDPIVIVNKIKKYDIKIAKKAEDGSFLEGAVLEITGTSFKGKDIDKITITSVAEAQTASLPAGTYTLHEVTPPNGYESAEDIEFIVAMDGTVSIGGKTVDQVEMTDKKKHEPKPLLSVKKTSNVTKAKPGDVIPYVITVNNKGDADAEDVVVLDTMGNNLSYVSDDSNGKHDGQKVSWDVKVPAGGSKIININCRINKEAAGKIINNVEISNVLSEYIEESGGNDEFSIVLGEYAEDEARAEGAGTGDESHAAVIMVFLAAVIGLTAMIKTRLS